MAASPPSLISTNANPRGRPVSRSMMTWTFVTVPYWENTSRSWSSVVEKAMFPTYKFFAIVASAGERGGGCPGDGRVPAHTVYSRRGETPQLSRGGLQGNSPLPGSLSARMGDAQSEYRDTWGAKK